MDVWVTWCKRRATCAYCHKEIESRTPMVVTSSWKDAPGPAGGHPLETKAKRWKIVKYYHFDEPQDCWRQNARAWLDTHPYENSTKRGRVPLALSPEDKRKRTNILIRRAKYVAELREALDLQLFNRIEHIVSKIHGLREEIEPLGGIPKSWDEEDEEESHIEVPTDQA